MEHSHLRALRVYGTPIDRDSFAFQDLVSRMKLLDRPSKFRVKRVDHPKNLLHRHRRPYRVDHMTSDELKGGEMILGRTVQLDSRYEFRLAISAAGAHVGHMP